MTRRAAFLDRDGTLIEERHYPADPTAVVLIPGTAAALRALADAGYALVVVTNQSGIARGLYAEAAFQAVQQRVTALLAEHGVRLDGVFHCPHHPAYSGPCDCRKPAVGLFRRAAGQLGIDPAASIYVGDRVRDVQPALALGGRGFLVRTGYGASEAEHAPPGIVIVDDLAAVAAHVGAVSGAAGGAATQAERPFRVDTPEAPE
jgi:D-glycero-D-manno-heptose 1,7-bisphosphate phosphatase